MQEIVTAQVQSRLASRGISMRWLNEPALVLLGYGVLAFVASSTGVSLWRALFAAVMGLFGTGYSMVAVLFPRRDQLDAVGRLALAGALSLAAGGMTGLLLAFAPQSLTLQGFLVATAAVNALCYVLAVGRRLRLAPDEVPYWPRGGQSGLLWWNRQSRSQKVVSLMLGLFLMMGAGAFYQATLVPPADPPMTEFYLLDDNGQTSDLPEQVAPGAILSVHYGIVNREGSAYTYQVRVMIGQQVLGGTFPARLGPGEEQNAALEVQLPPDLSGDQEVQYALYREGQPFRTLHLWLKVQ